MSFQIALSGLNAATTDLEVTGNNIANASTNGFKQSRVEYADVYANSLQDLSSTAAGRGTKVGRVAQQFSQGSVDFTSNNLDLAINGAFESGARSVRSKITITNPNEFYPSGYNLSAQDGWLLWQ